MSVTLYLDLKAGNVNEGRSEADFSNDRWNALLSAIDGNMAICSRADGNCGAVEASDVPAFLAKVIRALNSSKLDKHTSEASQTRNWYSAGIDRDYLERKLGEIAEICCTAVSNKSGLYWS